MSEGFDTIRVVWSCAGSVSCGSMDVELWDVSVCMVELIEACCK